VVRVARDVAHGDPLRVELAAGRLAVTVDTAEETEEGSGGR
jgi:hypothetical protein